MIFINHILTSYFYLFYKHNFFFRMNYTTLIVKLLGTPKKSSIENEIPVTEFIGKFYQYRKNKYTICKLIVWGNLADDLLKYYDTNDYMFVEGHVSIQESFIKELNVKTNIQISVYKAFPYALKLK